MEDILISYGNSIKTLETKGDLVTVGAYGLLWGGADLVGDYFTPDTHFGARKGLGVDTMVHHGIPLSAKLADLAYQLLPPTVKADADDTGLFVATVLDMRDQYQRKVFAGVEEGALAWSSGANPRAVRRAGNVKTGEILQWPIMEFSFTPTPCEPRLFRSIMPLKSLPLTMTEEPNYIKAVRVLADFNSFKSKSEEKADGPFDYCSTQVNLPEDAAKTVREWAAKLIPDEVLAEQGREDEPHITVLYGLHNDEPEAAQKVATGFGSITVKVGEVDVFEADGYDVVFLSVESPDLVNLREKLGELEHTKTHPEYHPHLTLAYVKSGEGAQFKGAKLAALDELTFDSFAFSDKEGNLTTIATKALSNDDDVPSVKSEIFSGIESRMTGACLRELVDDLMYRVVYDALYVSESQTVGMTRMEPLPIEERLTIVRRAFQEFQDIGLNIIETLMKGQGEEAAKFAAKSLNPFGQSFRELEAGLRAGLSFSDHSAKVLAAAEEFHSRTRDLCEMRAESRKAGRVLSETNATRIKNHREALGQICDDLDALLEAHTPGSVQTSEAPAGDAKTDEAQKNDSEPSTKDASEVAKALAMARARFEANRFTFISDELSVISVG